MDERFIGTWKLLSQHTLTPGGATAPTRGEHPAGVLMYDTHGNMAVQLMRTDARAGDYTDLAQLATAMEGYHAYFGTYEVDPALPIVRHRVIGCAYTAYIGTTQVRYYEFNADKLTLTVRADDGSRRVLVWQRVTGPLQYRNRVVA